MINLNKSDLKVESELSLNVTSGTGITVDVGHAYIPAVSYTGSDVSTNLQNVADITSPSSWTDLVDLSGSKMIVDIYNSSNTGLSISVDMVEDADEAIRAQILVDGTPVVDMTVTRDAGGVTANYIRPIVNSYSASTSYWIRFECNTSFKIRACYEGDGFTNAATFFKHGEVRYSKLA